MGNSPSHAHSLALQTTCMYIHVSCRQVTTEWALLLLLLLLLRGASHSASLHTAPAPTPTPTPTPDFPPLPLPLCATRICNQQSREKQGRKTICKTKGG